MTQPVQVLDAAMGKALKMQGVEIPATIWSANALLVAPDQVQQVHEDNIRAGADIITTNTYGVIRNDLRKENIEDRFEELNLLAVKLAKQAIAKADRPVAIAGSLPPLFGSYRPDLVKTESELEPLYAEQVKVLAPHVDMFICETMSHIDEARAAARAACQSGLPVIVSFTLHDETPATLRSGQSVADAIEAMKDIPVTGFSVNCCLPERITDALPALVASGKDIIGAYANAFTHVPTDWLIDGDKPQDGTLTLRDDLPPDIYAKFVTQWIALGATLIGGCCGTLAEHTAAVARTVSAHEAARATR